MVLLRSFLQKKILKIFDIFQCKSIIFNNRKISNKELVFMKKFPLIIPFLILSFLLSSCSRQEVSSDLAAKADLLWAQVEADWDEPEEKPAGEAGYVVDRKSVV